MSTTPGIHTDHHISERVWVRIMRIYMQIERRSAEIMKQHELSLSRFDVLVQAGVEEGRTQQELADAMFVTKGNVCQLLDGMEADRLLYRRRRGRTNLIYLTDDGRALRERALADQLAMIKEVMSTLSEAEQEQLNLLLRTLDKSLSA